jgi:hypothetical protein
VDVETCQGVDTSRRKLCSRKPLQFVDCARLSDTGEVDAQGVDTTGLHYPAQLCSERAVDLVFLVGIDRRFTVVKQTQK